jgi:hypothetical protein
MKQPDYAVGDLVKVTSGVYADAVGAVSDIQPECSAVRIETKEGFAYAFADAVTKLPSTKKEAKPLNRRR